MAHKHMVGQTGPGAPDLYFLTQRIEAINSHLRSCWSEVSTMSQLTKSIDAAQANLQAEHEDLREKFQQLVATLAAVLPTSGGGLDLPGRRGYGRDEPGGMMIPPPRPPPKAMARESPTDYNLSIPHLDALQRLVGHRTGPTGDFDGPQSMGSFDMQQNMGNYPQPNLEYDHQTNLGQYASQFDGQPNLGQYDVQQGLGQFGAPGPQMPQQPGPQMPPYNWQLQQPVDQIGFQQHMGSNRTGHIDEGQHDQMASISRMSAPQKAGPIGPPPGEKAAHLTKKGKREKAPKAPGPLEQTRQAQQEQPPPPPLQQPIGQSGASGPTGPPQGFPGSTSGSAIFIVGGDPHRSFEAITAEIFDIGSMTFSELPPLLARHGSHCSAAAAGGKLYIFGGGVSAETVTTVSVFDPDTWLWDQMTPMPTPRVGSTAVNVAGSIYVCGGYDGGTNGDDTDVVEKFDTRNNTWSTVTPMSSTRSHCCAAPSELMLYVIGGFSTRNKCSLNICERLAPRKSKWEVVASMSTPRRGAAAAAVKGNLFVCGGNDGKDDLRSVEAYDPGANAWSVMAAPLSCPRVNCLMASVAGELFVFGGHSASGAHISGERIDGNGQQMEPLPGMISKRSWCIGASWTRSGQKKR